MEYVKSWDFRIDGKYNFEVGGKTKPASRFRVSKTALLQQTTSNTVTQKNSA